MVRNRDRSLRIDRFLTPRMGREHSFGSPQGGVPLGRDLPWACPELVEGLVSFHAVGVNPFRQGHKPAEAVSKSVPLEPPQGR